MKPLLGSVLLLLFVLTPAAQKNSVDLEKEKRELLKLHELDRQAHFQTDAELLLSHHPEAGFISVSNGKISRTTKDDTQKTFAAYFKDARYYEWSDLEPPIVRVSQDASMAWLITRLKVRRTQKNSSGLEEERKFVYAGIMTYEKKNGTWTRSANVSTFE